MERRKVYVDVDVSILKKGKVYPRRFRYEDGTVFQVERLIDTCKAQSTRVGGEGIRYTVMILGHVRYLFDERGKWFVEAKVV